MVSEGLSGIINAMKHDSTNHDAILRTRHILHAMRDSSIPMYVVVHADAMFVVSDYLAAMIYADVWECDVWSVWRDTDCIWHATKQ